MNAHWVHLFRLSAVALAIQAWPAAAEPRIHQDRAAVSGAAAQAPATRYTPVRVAAPTPAEGPRYIVWSRAGASNEDMQATLVPHRGRMSRLGGSNLHVVELPTASASASGASGQRALAQRLQRHPHVRRVEEDRILQPGFTINDPYLGSLWHLEKVGAPAAWDLALGRGVTIAVLDSGVNSQHPDLAPNIVPGWNVADNNSDTSDLTGHGTSVAGVAAAAANNGLGVAGMAAQARIMPVRVALAGGNARTSDIAKGIIYAADNGARIVNISYAGVSESFAAIAAAQYLRAKGGLVFVAAGNNGVDEKLPATTDMIPVAATNPSDQRPSWGSYGAHVALAAPGELLWTTARDGTYRAASGSSFATPLAAGLAAVMMAANPKADVADIEKWLFATAVDIGTPGRDAEFGYGRINAAAAVAKAQAGAASVAPLVQNAVVDIEVTANAATATTAANWQVQVQVQQSGAGQPTVARVELRANGALIGNDTQAPYQFVIDPAAYAPGVVRLAATAYDASGRALGSVTRDQVKAASAGAMSSSTTSTTNTTSTGNSGSATTSSRTATTVAPGGDRTPPVITLVSPVADSTVSGTVAVQARLSDDRGTTGMAYLLFIDGVLASIGQNKDSITHSWDSRSAAGRAVDVRVMAFDAAGNMSLQSVVVKVAK